MMHSALWWSCFCLLALAATPSEIRHDSARPVHPSAAHNPPMSLDVKMQYESKCDTSAMESVAMTRAAGERQRAKCKQNAVSSDEEGAPGTEDWRVRRLSNHGAFSDVTSRSAHGESPSPERPRMQLRSRTREGVYLPKVLSEAKSYSDMSRSSSPAASASSSTSLQSLSPFQTKGTWRHAQIFKPSPFSTWANEAVRICMIRREDDLHDASRQFHPLFTHQVFGPREEIVGYEDPHIQIVYAANSLAPCILFRSGGKVDSEQLVECGVSATDVYEPVRRFAPADYASLQQVLDSAADSTYTPPGSRVGGYMAKVSDPPSLANGGKRVGSFAVYESGVRGREAAALVQRVQSLALWLIERASYITADDNWVLLTLYQTRDGVVNVEQEQHAEEPSMGQEAWERRAGAGEQGFELVGFVTLYKDRRNPKLPSTMLEDGTYRLRISQFVILPPFQRCGHGGSLLRLIYARARAKEEVLEVCVENPSEGFSRLRDKVDTRVAQELDCFDMLLVVPLPVEQLRTTLKLPRTQIRHLSSSVVRKVVTALPVPRPWATEADSEEGLCAVDRRVFHAGDFVTVQGEGPDGLRDLVGVLVGVNPTSRLVRVRWMYRWHDVPREARQGAGRALGAALRRVEASGATGREVFLTLHEDFIPSDSILAPAAVVFVMREGDGEEQGGGAELVCRSVYDPGRHRLYALGEKHFKSKAKRAIAAVMQKQEERERQGVRGSSEADRQGGRQWGGARVAVSFEAKTRSAAAEGSSGLTYSEQQSDMVPYSPPGIGVRRASGPVRFRRARRVREGRSGGEGVKRGRERRGERAKTVVATYRGQRARPSQAKTQRRRARGGAVQREEEERGGGQYWPRELGKVIGGWGEDGRRWDGLRQALNAGAQALRRRRSKVVGTLTAELQRPGEGGLAGGGDGDGDAEMGEEGAEAAQTACWGLGGGREELAASVEKGLLRGCGEVLRRLRRRVDAEPFLQPVDPERDRCPDYHDTIKHPMDLGTVQGGLAAEGYRTADAVWDHVLLTFRNAMLYNPPQHPVHLQARRLLKTFGEGYAVILAAAADVLDKYGGEKQGWRVDAAAVVRELSELPDSAPFLRPVDPVALGIPDYPSVISQPMDLGTVRRKMQTGEYERQEEVRDDLELTMENALQYNPPGHPVHEAASRLRARMRSQWQSLVLPSV